MSPPKSGAYGLTDAFADELSQPSTKAGILKRYLPSRASGKMVDFCLTLHRGSWGVNEANDARADQIRSLPDASINHTAFLPLLNDPICVSIETKTPEVGPDQSQLGVQVGTWQAAHWKLLAAQVERNVVLAAGDHAEPADIEERTARSLASLPFLPAIIIAGHNWSFEASTRTGHQTVGRSSASLSLSLHLVQTSKC